MGPKSSARCQSRLSRYHCERIGTMLSLPVLSPTCKNLCGTDRTMEYGLSRSEATTSSDRCLLAAARTVYSSRLTSQEVPGHECRGTGAGASTWRYSIISKATMLRPSPSFSELWLFGRALWASNILALLKV